MSYFQIFMDYQESMLVLQEPIKWALVKKQLPATPTLAYNKVLRGVASSEINAFEERKIQKDIAD